LLVAICFALLVNGVPILLAYGSRAQPLAGFSLKLCVNKAGYGFISDQSKHSFIDGEASV